MDNYKIIGGAGEHYVAYALSCFGYIPALAREGSPTIDLLVSNLIGSRTLAIQVKTTAYANAPAVGEIIRNPTSYSFLWGIDQ